MSEHIDPQRPLSIIDVGSRGGIQARWKAISRIVPFRFTGFEPDAAECDNLNRQAAPQEQYIPVALGAEAGDKTFNITRAPGNCGLYPPDPIFTNRFKPARDYDVVATQTFAVATLDQVAEDYQLGEIDFIKSDTEGGDLDVLLGAKRCLQSSFGVEVEVWFNVVYQGQPLFADVDQNLRSIGFSLFDVARANFPKRTAGQHLGTAKGQLLAGDAVYFRDLLREQHDPIFWRPDKFAKSIGIVIAYGYYDYGLEVVQAARDWGKIDDDMAGKLTRVICNAGRRPFPRIRGQHRLANLLKRASFQLSLKEVDRLGN